jgi:hypothetical protein
MIARLPKCLEELIKKCVKERRKDREIESISVLFYRCWDEGSHKRPTFREIMSKLERLVKVRGEMLNFCACYNKQ